MPGACADVGREEFEEAHAGAFAGGSDECRPEGGSSSPVMPRLVAGASRSVADCPRDRRGQTRSIHTACPRAGRDGRQPWRPAKRHGGRRQLDLVPASKPIFRIGFAGPAVSEA
jgi:hypothetical protein